MLHPRLFWRESGGDWKRIEAGSLFGRNEEVRARRFVSVVLEGVIIIAPWLLSGASTGLILNGAVAGAAVLLLSLPRGPVRERYGPWSRYVS